ncbi:hypothetical protein [Acinetobacter sp.]|jgi:hypothetical protein|uniref:hypothetical protein n=1 Tax=Acinetobacter sp. TaxID=472 RepID=UPI002836C2DA|nr:hypothetical protein [Acinetobacter sp.]MDR0238461.1 hypothetical protein [Acinetobacter sp.]
MFKIINTTVFLIACTSSLSFAQQPTQSLEKFIPKHWEILSQTKGDLNQDGKQDIAILIQPKNKHQLERKLLILFQTDQQLQLKLIRSIPNWTYRSDEPCLEDAFNDSSLTIKNQHLEILFDTISSCSNTYGLMHTYSFKLKNNQFDLIGYDTFYLDKISGKQDELSINFLTKKAKLTTTANIFAEVEAPPKIVWKTVKSTQKYTLANIPWNSDEFNDSFSTQYIGRK